MKKQIVYIVLITLAFTPLAVVFAQQPPVTTLGGFLDRLTGIIGILIPLIFAITFLTITWGAIKAWIMGDATENDIDAGKKIVFVGVIALTIMASIWGIVRLLRNGLFGG